MVIQMFSVYDKKALYFGTPFPAQTSAEATRMVSDAIQFEDTLLAKHPHDYDLYHLGSYDNSKGTFNLDTPAKLITPLSALLVGATLSADTE